MIEKQYNQVSASLKIVNHSLLILMMVLGAGILLLGYFWLIKPKMEAIDLQKSQIISVQDKQQQNKIFVDSLKKLEAEYNAILSQRQEDFDRLNKLMPTEPQIAELFSLSEILATKNGLEVTSVDFSGDFDGTADTSEAAKDENGQPVSDDGLSRVIIHLVVKKLLSEDGRPLDGQTSYQSFKKYLDTLEKSLRLMDITTVSFDTLIEGSEEPQADVFNFDIITYYRQND